MREFWRSPRMLLPVCAALALLFAPAAATAGNPDIPSAVAERLKFIELLKAGQFDTLDDRIGKIFYGHLTGKEFDPIFAFARADPAIAGPLARWRKMRPDHFAPHLAFGLYSEHIGWEMRGGRWARETYPQRFQEMNKFLDAASAAFHAALKLNPKIAMAWEGLIDIAKARGDRRTLYALFNEAIRHRPKSWRIYEAYYDALAPKWGGSKADQFALRARMQSMFAGNPDFAWLENVEERHEAWDLFNRDKGAEALLKFDDLLRRHDTAGDRSGRALALRQIGRYADSVEEYRRLLTGDPGNPKAYYNLAIAEMLLPKLWPDGVRNATIALMLDPYNAKMLIMRADLLMKLGKRTAAKKDLDDALLFGALDDSVRDSRREYFSAIGDLDAAAGEAELAVRLLPTSLGNWFEYALALSANRDCRSVQAFQTYLNGCHVTKKCDAGQEEHATLLMSGAKSMCN